MKTIIAAIFITAVSLTPTIKSQAQTVRDDNAGEVYFEKQARVLCGARAHIYVSATSATVMLSGEYIQDRNLNEVARNLALEGLNAFPESPSFTVTIQDSKGTGSATVK